MNGGFLIIFLRDNCEVASYCEQHVLRMKVKNLTPHPRIAEYVERILVIETSTITTAFSLPLFANGLPTLVFKSVKGTIRNSYTSHLTLFGQTILPEVINFTEGFTLIAYFFKPYSLQTLFGVPAPQLTDKPVDLNLLKRSNVAGLQEQLLNYDSVEDRINQLDNYICNLIAAAKKGSTIIKYATARIGQNSSKKILGLVQRELCITERTFERLFEKNIGVSPNLYRRICQFNKAFHQLNNRSFYKLTDIAFANGYTDQSHFIRSFKEFTNITPKDYLNLGSPPQE